MAIASVCVAIAAAAVGVSVGGYMDDLLIASWARSTGWGDILTLKAAPLPFYLITWKIAGYLNTETPYLPVHMAAGVLHGLNCFLIWLLLKEFVREEYALAGFVLAAIFRPTNEAWLWAGAQNDALVSAFILTTFVMWLKGRTDPAWRWYSTIPFALAMLAKPTAVCLPVVLLLYELWFSPEPGFRLKVKAVLDPFFVMCLIAGFFAAYSYNNRGLWTGVYPKKVEPQIGMAVLGETLLRSLLIVRPAALVGNKFVCWSFAGFSALLALAAERRVRLGLCLVIGILIPAVMTTGMVGGRYLYPGAFGLILALTAVTELLVDKWPAVRVPVIALGAIWLGLHLFGNTRDWRFRRQWSRVFEDTRALVREHRQEIIDANILHVVNDGQPVEPWTSQIVYYETGKRIPADRGLTKCPDRPGPCLAYRENYYTGPNANQGRYPEEKDFPFVQLTSGRAASDVGQQSQ